MGHVLGAKKSYFLIRGAEADKAIERIARRVLGGAHPTTVGVEAELQYSRAALRERETPSTSP